MEKGKFADLVAYFEQIARNHKDIRHTDSEKHFFRFELEEMLTGMRSKINYPALVLEGYDFEFTDEKSDNVHKRLNCAFMILGKVTDKGDFDLIHDLWDRLEEIGDEIIIRILSDKRSRVVPVLTYFSMNSVNGAPLTDLQLVHYGYRYAFTLSWPCPNDPDSQCWSDLNTPTP